MVIVFFPTKITVRDVDIEQLQQKDNVSSSEAVIKRIFLSEMCLQMRKVSSVVIQRSRVKGNTNIRLISQNNLHIPETPPIREYSSNKTVFANCISLLSVAKWLL